MEAAIAEGPEALQKIINSGEIEELQDVLPHDEEHDYLNDAYLDDDNEESGASGNQNFRGQMNLQSRMQGPGLTLNLDEKMNNTLRFGDGDMDMRQADQDMRKINQPFPNNCNMMNSGDVDLRNPHNQDIDFRNRDYDMRHLNTDVVDEDFRMPFNRDQDFRNNRYEEEDNGEMYEEDYSGNYQDPREWHNRGGNFNQRNQNNFGPNGHNFQNFRNQGPGFERNEQFRPPNEYWGPNSDNNFRGRGGRRGSARGIQRGRGNMRQNRGGGRGQSARGGPPLNRGGARGRNMF